MPYDANAEDELQLYINNDGWMYKNHTRPLHQRLILAKLAGTYDRLRALKGFDAVVREGTRRYAKEFPGSTFSTSDKKDAASDMLSYFETEYKLGNMKPDGPVKPMKVTTSMLGHLEGYKPGAVKPTNAQLDRDIAESLATKRKR